MTPAETDALVLSEQLAGGVRVLTLNRPQAYNALSAPLMQAVIDALDAAHDDPACRAIVLTGAGKGFSAGHDLKEVKALETPEERLALFRLCADMMLKIQSVRQPVIAAVHGIATAAGCQIVATCDLAIAEEGARFATPGVNIGLFCSTPLVALSRSVSHKAAMEMLLTGDMVSAERAVGLGLINHAVAEGEAVNAAVALAERIAAKSTAVLKVGKEAFYAQRAMNTADAYALTAQVMAANLGLEDAQEGIAAFIGKRHPEWQDK